jgi:hypothetical protein
MKSEAMKRAIAGVFGLGAALLLSGCSSYQLGPTNGLEAGARSVRVNFFENRTGEPRLATYVNSALRKRIQQDGTYRLATRGDADIVINGSITSFSRSALTYQPGDSITARDYRVFLTAHVTAIDSASGATALERDVIGRTTIRLGADLGSVERQATPLLAEDLARNITALLADGSW